MPLLVLLLSLYSFLVVDTARPGEPVWITDMRYCDLVVQGTIESASTELKPRLDAMPMLPGGNSDDFVPVAMVRLKVREVMRGDLAEETVDFVSFVGLSGYKDNYEPGQEVIVGLIWGMDVLGGSYWLFSDTTRFVRGRDAWEEQRGDTVLTDLTGIERALANAAPWQVLRDADAVVTGDVRNVSLHDIESKDGTRGVEMVISLENVQWIGGREGASELVVRQIMSGDYWPYWRDSAPWREMPVKGRKYCLSLRSIDGGFVVFGGVNGTFEVREDQLYFAGRSPVNLTTRQIREMEQNK